MVEVVHHRRSIVTALPLKPPARQRLAQLLDARVLDIRDNCDAADMVLTPPCSPQLLGKLARRFEGARIVIVELDDWDLDIALPGPVKRQLRAGAAAYVLADSLEELAAKIGTAPHRTQDRDEPAAPGELPTGTTVDELIAAFLRESVEYSTRAQTAGTDHPEQQAR